MRRPRRRCVRQILDEHRALLTIAVLLHIAIGGGIQTALHRPWPIQLTTPWFARIWIWGRPCGSLCMSSSGAIRNAPGSRRTRSSAPFCSLLWRSRSRSRFSRSSRPSEKSAASHGIRRWPRSTAPCTGVRRGTGMRSFSIARRCSRSSTSCMCSGSLPSLPLSSGCAGPTFARSGSGHCSRCCCSGLAPAPSVPGRSPAPGPATGLRATLTPRR